MDNTSSAASAEQAGGMAGMEIAVGQKVIVYTVIMRGSAQTSYVGAVTSISAVGLTIESSAGRIFFPWTAVERATW